MGHHDHVHVNHGHFDSCSVVLSSLAIYKEEEAL